MTPLFFTLQTAVLPLALILPIGEGDRWAFHFWSYWIQSSKAKLSNDESNTFVS